MKLAVIIIFQHSLHYHNFVYYYFSTILSIYECQKKKFIRNKISPKSATGETPTFISKSRIIYHRGHTAVEAIFSIRLKFIESKIIKVCL